MMTRSTRTRVRASIAGLAAVAMMFAAPGVAVAATAEPTEAPAASISGTVVDSTTAEPVEGASVMVIDAVGSHAGSATTAGSGGYTVSGLAPGAYRVSVSASPDYEPLYWPNASTLAGATPIDLVSGQPYTGADVSLLPDNDADVPTSGEGVEASATYAVADGPTAHAVATEAPEPVEYAPTVPPARELDAAVAAVSIAATESGSISGRITRGDTGVPVAGVWVRVSAGPTSASATSSADGSYVLDGLDAGDYELFFYAWEETGLLSAGSEAAGIGVVTVDGAMTGIDVVLTPEATISGTVTQESDGMPVPGALVVATLVGGSARSFAVSTDVDGTYRIRGLASGAYGVAFIGTAGLVDEYWDSQLTLGAAGNVDVGTGVAVAGIDASLQSTTAMISGVVTRESDGSPVEEVTVRAQRTGSSDFELATTDESGAYEMTGVNPGDYIVSFSAWALEGDESLATEYWNGVHSSAEAEVVSIDRDDARTGINASLVAPGSVAGTVDGITSGSAVVTIHPASRPDEIAASEFVDRTTGAYLLTGLAPGDYVVKVEPRFGTGAYLAMQYYKGAPTADQAERVTVRSDQTNTGIDFTLTRGVDITGTVSAPTRPNSGVQAIAYRWSGAAWQEVRRITAWGEYSFGDVRVSGKSSALPSGTYTVGFEGEGYCTQYWDGVSSLDAATSFTPEVGTTQSGIDAVLSAECDTPAVTPGTPTISGTAKVGETLTAAPGTWGPSPVELAYQWLADGTAIDGATAASLPLTSAQRGKTITVTVTGSRPGYTSASATSAPAGPVTASIAAGTPTITGTAVAGETLTAHPGTWAPSGVALTYQWSAGGAEIAGATGETFVPGTTEVGKTVTVTVVGSRAGYTSASATSAPFGPITAAVLEDLDPGTPTISGTPKLGQPLTVRPGEWGPAPVELTYQWVVDGENVASATGETYTPDAAAVGKNVSVIVRGSKAGYNSATAQAEPVGPVAAGALTPGEPTIGGTPQTGQTLTVDPGTWGPAPVDFAYQWLIDGEPVSGATGTTFVPDASQVGTAVTVTVAGTKPGYATESRTSAPVTIELGALTASTPVIAGVIGVGRELTADVSAWGPAPLDFTYQWLAGEEPIDGATNATFTPDASFVGATIGVTVTGSRPGYASETRTATAGIVPASIVVSEPRVERGQTVTVTGEFYAPNEEVLLELGSDSIELARVTTDAEGRFSAEVTIPATAELAEHEVVGTGQTSGRVGTAPLTVYVPGATPTPTPSASGTPAALPDTLPVSGGTLPIAAIVIGTSLLVAGGLIVRRRRAMS